MGSSRTADVTSVTACDMSVLALDDLQQVPPHASKASAQASIKGRLLDTVPAPDDREPQGWGQAQGRGRAWRAARRRPVRGRARAAESERGQLQIDGPETLCQQQNPLPSPRGPPRRVYACQPAIHTRETGQPPHRSWPRAGSK